MANYPLDSTLEELLLRHLSLLPECLKSPAHWNAPYQIEEELKRRSEFSAHYASSQLADCVESIRTGVITFK